MIIAAFQNNSITVFSGLLKFGLCLKILKSIQSTQQGGLSYRFLLPLSPLCVCMPSHFSHIQHSVTMQCSLPGSSVYGILQARILGCVVMPFLVDLPDPGSEPALAGRFITSANWEGSAFLFITMCLTVPPVRHMLFYPLVLGLIT